MQALADTIVALITGNPPAGVAWVRVSGPQAWAVVKTVFHPWPENPRHLVGIYGSWLYGDDGIALPFESGRGYTGEESVEISMHGSRASITAAIEACIQAGARLAEPGEFTRRAFQNGNLDLTQAEAVRDTIDAQTHRQLNAAFEARLGLVRIWVESLRDRFVRLLSALEASVDFSEEIGEFNREAAAEVCDKALLELDDFISRASASQVLRHGLRIALVGPPNAGKSSLLNALLGHDRAIVMPTPGTTRDYIEELVDFGGYPVVLIDTAGLREVEDEAEALGIQRSRAQASQADVVWYLYDAAIGIRAEDTVEMERFTGPVQLIANKVDLAPPSSGIPISALTKEGIAELIQSVAKHFDHSPPPSTSPRVITLLNLARQSLTELRDALKTDVPDDLLSVLFADVIHRLGEITGDTASVDMIDRIFHDFCIGK